MTRSLVRAILISTLLPALVTPLAARTILGNCDGCSAASVRNRGRSLSIVHGASSGGVERALVYDAVARRLWEVTVTREYDRELRRWLIFAAPPVAAPPSVEAPVIELYEASDDADAELAIYSAGAKMGDRPPRDLLISRLDPFGPPWNGGEITPSRINDIHDALRGAPPLAAFHNRIQRALDQVDQSITFTSGSGSSESISGRLGYQGVHVTGGVNETRSSGRQTTTRTKPTTRWFLDIELWDHSVLTMCYHPQRDLWRLQRAVDPDNNPLPFDENGDFRPQLIPTRLVFRPGGGGRGVWAGIADSFNLGGLAALIAQCSASETCTVVTSASDF